MEDQGFDRIARAVAAARSRRVVVKALAGAAAGGLLAVRSGRGVGIASDRVLICHRTGSAANPFVLIEISSDAIPEHDAHGDGVDLDGVDLDRDPKHCGSCGNACNADEACINGFCEGSCVIDGDKCSDKSDCCNKFCCNADGICDSTSCSND